MCVCVCVCVAQSGPSVRTSIRERARSEGSLNRRSSQQAGGDLASKLQLARVMDELDEQRRTHATQVCRVCVCVCVYL